MIGLSAAAVQAEFEIGEGTVTLVKFSSGNKPPVRGIIDVPMKLKGGSQLLHVEPGIQIVKIGAVCAENANRLQKLRNFPNSKSRQSGSMKIHEKRF